MGPFFIDGVGFEGVADVCGVEKHVHAESLVLVDGVELSRGESSLELAKIWRDDEERVVPAKCWDMSVPRIMEMIRSRKYFLSSGLKFSRMFCCSSRSMKKREAAWWFSSGDLSREAIRG